VAYDERLVDRIREPVEAEPLLTEQRMFGGLAFLIGGNMAVATSGQGGALIRVDPAKSARLIATTAAEPMLIGARSMDESISTPSTCAPSQLENWIEIGVSVARSLPPKHPTQR
jgi:hypothetical protein